MKFNWVVLELRVDKADGPDMYNDLTGLCGHFKSLQSAFIRVQSSTVLLLFHHVAVANQDLFVFVMSQEKQTALPASFSAVNRIQY